ncbi:type I restriction endonuclease subunit R [Salicibibacter kimchii]|uniref:Type I restriction enzyme endonuclease subunit n=1 Tax=Salicibibacter kimchii TaxID=2099786 RepID=A0A345BVQ3_9BACI|nr:type I restriction endonuclease subunit R [Salicibibacter kimchii]AXF55034.1 type I restriction endonuclease subunit R [Salicibibacter kimchii]
MTRLKLGESDFEETTIERLERLGYEYLHAQELFQRGERASLKDVTLPGRLQAFLRETYPDLPEEEIPAAANQFLNPQGLTSMQRNEHFHTMMTKGIDFPFEKDGETVYQHLFPINWEDPEANDFLVVNQLSIEGKVTRIPDVIVYINGLPLVVMELKNPNDEQATVQQAFIQIRNYTVDIYQLFNFNAFSVISDNTETRHGMPFHSLDYFSEWKTTDGRTVDNNKANSMRTMIEGLFPKKRFLAYIRNFILFMDDGDHVTKIGAKYHQFFGVQFSVDETVRATRPDGDRKIGTIWHTQGSGKSISMLFFAAILIKHPEMQNPTIVIQVDRNDLDQQLFETFVAGQSHVGHVHHAKNADQLREMLRGEAGQIIFSTIEKFRTKEEEGIHPVLSERRNIVVIADEAHRTQYSDTGFAGHLQTALPNASHIGFTGTPIALTDRNTKEVFGNVIHSYDMAQAVQDQATVPIYYEPRLIPLDVAEEALDEEYEEVVEFTGDEELDQHKRKWAALEKVVGTKQRLRRLAADIVDHFTATADPFSKAMIVCMSREIAVRLYDELKEEPDCPPVEVIMTGKISEDPIEWRDVQSGSKYAHIKTKEEQEEVKAKLRDPEEPLKMVIVVDMWLTGMDAKPLTYLYVDKPMKGHNLMQAIARVNRVFPGKEGGVIVDYIRIAEHLQAATKQYTNSGGEGQPTFDIDKAVQLFEEQLTKVRAFIPNYLDITHWRYKPKMDREDLIAAIVNEVHEEPEPFLEAEKKLEKAQQLVKNIPEVRENLDEMVLYQMVRSQIKKLMTRGSEERERNETMDERMNRLVDDNVLAKETVDLYQIAGIDKPDINILDEDFIENKKDDNQHEDLRMKLLKKLLQDEIRQQYKPNSPQERSFREMLQKTVDQYHQGLIQSADVMKMMMEVRNGVHHDAHMKEELGLSEEEIEFFKALEARGEHVFDNEFLADLIQNVVRAMKKEFQVDWTKTHRQDVYLKVKNAVKMVLRKEQIKGEQFKFLTNTFIKQAEEQFRDWPKDA